MKELFLFSLALAISTSASSQVWSPEGKETTDSKIKFGIKAGFAFANCRVEYNTTIYPDRPKPITKLGAAGGVFVRMPLSKKACFQPELLMVGKGMKEKNQYPYRNDITYLELPLNVLYKRLSDKGSFFIGGGPAPAFYIGENIFYSGEKPFKGFDFGINFLSGYEIPIGFSVNLHYTYGLTNISGNRSEVTMLKNRCFGLMIGYYF